MHLNLPSLSVFRLLLGSIASKIQHWSMKFLCYYGRLQLLNSAIFGILNYWCTPFFLPNALLKEVEKLCCRFFWNYANKDKKMFFFSWNKFCEPNIEEGFNVKEALSWNKVLACKWIYKLLDRKGVWAIWACSYHLPNLSIWDVAAKKWIFGFGKV